MVSGIVEHRQKKVEVVLEIKSEDCQLASRECSV